MELSLYRTKRGFSSGPIVGKMSRISQDTPNTLTVGRRCRGHHIFRDLSRKLGPQSILL